MVLESQNDYGKANYNKLFKYEIKTFRLPLTSKEIRYCSIGWLQFFPRYDNYHKVYSQKGYIIDKS